MVICLVEHPFQMDAYKLFIMTGRRLMRVYLGKKSRLYNYISSLILTIKINKTADWWEICQTMDSVFWLVLFWAINIFFVFLPVLFKFAVLNVNSFYNPPSRS